MSNEILVNLVAGDKAHVFAEFVANNIPHDRWPDDFSGITFIAVCYHGKIAAEGLALARKNGLLITSDISGSQQDGTVKIVLTGAAALEVMAKYKLREPLEDGYSITYHINDDATLPGIAGTNAPVN